MATTCFYCRGPITGVYYFARIHAPEGSPLDVPLHGDCLKRLERDGGRPDDATHYRVLAKDEDAGSAEWSGEKAT